MTVVVTLRGALSPTHLEEDFLSTVNSLNMASAQGKEFVVSKNLEGNNVAIAMHNILTIEEVDD